MKKNKKPNVLLWFHYVTVNTITDNDRSADFNHISHVHINRNSLHKSWMTLWFLPIFAILFNNGTVLEISVRINASIHHFHGCLNYKLQIILSWKTNWSG